MLPDYSDIKALTDREPDWYDQDGVPRYAPYEPDMLGVYDKWSILVEIACQACGQKFLVGCGYTIYVKRHDEFVKTFEDLFGDPAKGDFYIFHYGDPPRHGCVGDTMNCEDLRIVEAWEQNPDWRDWENRWLRRPDIETINITCDWAKEISPPSKAV